MRATLLEEQLHIAGSGALALMAGQLIRMVLCYMVQRPLLINHACRRPLYTSVL